MTLTTINLFGEVVEYPKTNLNDTNQNQESEKIVDCSTGNLFEQDIVKNKIKELFEHE